MESVKVNQSMFHKIKGQFIKGLLIIIPITVSLYIIWWFFKSLDLILGNVLKKYLGFYFYGIGFILLILIVWIIGFILSGFLGKKFLKLYDSIVKRIPILKNIFKTVKQISDSVLDNQKRSFKQVVLGEFFRENFLSIGFITSDMSVKVKNEKKEKVHVFVPTAPNPTSGFLILCEEEKLIKLDVPVEQAFKSIISAGMAYPDQYK